jgi:hypothetical protein
MAANPAPCPHLSENTMPRTTGPLQRKILAALRRHGREAPLEDLAALAANLIADLDLRPPYGRAPSAAQYKATARAVAALRRRGLVAVERFGVAKRIVE